jgi:hypothetical protein
MTRVRVVAAASTRNAAWANDPLNLESRNLSKPIFPVPILQVTHNIAADKVPTVIF